MTQNNDVCWIVNTWNIHMERMWYEWNETAVFLASKPLKVLDLCATRATSPFRNVNVLLHFKAEFSQLRTVVCRSRMNTSLLWLSHFMLHFSLFYELVLNEHRWPNLIFDLKSFSIKSNLLHNIQLFQKYTCDHSPIKSKQSTKWTIFVKLEDNICKN